MKQFLVLILLVLPCSCSSCSPSRSWNPRACLWLEPLPLQMTRQSQSSQSSSLIAQREPHLHIISKQPCDRLHDVMTAAFSGRQNPASLFPEGVHQHPFCQIWSGGCRNSPVTYAQRASSARRRLAICRTYISRIDILSQHCLPSPLNPWNGHPVESERSWPLVSMASPVH